MEPKEFVATLRKMPEGIERDLFLFRWKYSYPNFKFGLFSTKHDGDCAGNLLKVLDGELTWDNFAIIDGQKVLLELEKNFNAFINYLKFQLLTKEDF